MYSDRQREYLLTANSPKKKKKEREDLTSEPIRRF